MNRMAAAGTWEDPRIVGPTFAGEQAWKTYATDLMAHKVWGSVSARFEGCRESDESS